MKIKVLLKIEDGIEQGVAAEALNIDTAIVSIHAETWQEVPALLSQAQDLATEAMKNWKPDEAAPTEPEPQQHYYTTRYSIEEMDAAATEYEGTYNGRRFMASIKNARDFYFKHADSRAGIHCVQLGYLANKHYNSLLNGSFDLSALAYRHGYKEGQKAAKAKK